MTAGEPNQCPTLPEGLLCPTGQEQELYESNSNCSQVAQSTTVKKNLVKSAVEIRHDYKYGAVDKGLGKSLVVLTKVQD